MGPLRMTALIGGKRYSTDASTLLAHGEYTGGPEWSPPEKITFLFRTRDGRFFAQHRSQPNTRNVHNERYWVEPLAEIEAIPLYWELPDKDADFSDAFSPEPGAERTR